MSPDDEQWATWVEVHACDIYQHPAYLQAAALHESGEPVAFFAENDEGALLVPLLLRDIPGTTYRDATSPYGYPAPVWSAKDPEAHVSALIETLREKRIVSVFLRLHPLLPGPGDVGASGTLGGSVLSQTVHHGPTVWLDRRAPKDKPEENDVLERTRPDHRSDIRRLLREGYSVELHRPDAPGMMDAFREVYTATMDRVNASPFYYFSDAYFESWTNELADYADLAIVRDAGGDVAAAGMFTRHQRWMQFHLSGTAEAHRSYAPTKLMLHRMRDATWTTSARLSNDGAHPHNEPPIFHLGGGLNAARDSLFDFKAGFSNCRASFSTWRIICDPPTYASLSRQHLMQEANRTDSGDAPNPETAGLDGGYFPAYRR